MSLEEPVKRFKTSVFRSNLYYEIVFRDFLKEDQFDNLKKFIDKCLSIDDNNRNCGKNINTKIDRLIT